MINQSQIDEILKNVDPTIRQNYQEVIVETLRKSDPSKIDALIETLKKENVPRTKT